MSDTKKLPLRLTPRQGYILNTITASEGITREAIQKKIAVRYNVSKPTLIRELNFLAENETIRSVGAGRKTFYKVFSQNPLLNFVDIDTYFADDPDKRENVKPIFDFYVFDNLHNLFTPQEEENIAKVKKSFREQTQSLNRDGLRRELERFTIELSWKSSKIEGNTYSLLETETLILQNRKAPGHTEQEAKMILNHKQAFQTILSSPGDFKTLDLSKINQLHNVLVKGLDITPGIRDNAVGITGSVYRPLDNKHQIREAMERLIKHINDTATTLNKALIVQAMIPYIQPYTDGNKRTARMLTNALLLAYDYYPLSYRSVDEDEFKKAIILFYEQNSIFHVKRLFIEQLIFAYKTYFIS